MFFWFSFIILLFSLSLDTLIAGISIGLSKIKVPLSSLLIICLINTIMLTISYLFGEKIHCFLPDYAITLLSSIPFLFLGFNKIAIYKKKNITLKKKRKTSLIQSILSIFKSPESAYIIDLDFSQTLSIKELILLAISLSLDNLIAGLGLNIKPNLFFLVFILNFSISFFLFLIGNRIFLKFTNYSINWNSISGLIFIFVGIYRIFS